MKFTVASLLLAFAILSEEVSAFVPNSRSVKSWKLASSVATEDKPKWAAGGFVSDVVNALISFKPLYSLMKVGARKTLIETAEKNGIPWRERSNALKNQDDKLSRYAEQLTNPSVVDYPQYYTQEFHAYDEGNLNWQAAYECESATMSMALRVYPKDDITAEEAQDRLRNSFSNAVKSYIAKTRKSKPNTIVDLGCSVGISTFYLARAFPNAKTIDALDLSTYFLAIAKQRQEILLDKKVVGGLGEKEMSKFSNVDVKRIKWIHGYAEKTSFPSGRYDLTTASFMFHELPTIPADNIINEMYRITASGGSVAITDNNPRSPVIQGLPPALFTLMKSTEPWSDQYYVYDMEGALERAGFKDVVTIATDPRHRTVLGRKP